MSARTKTIIILILIIVVTILGLAYLKSKALQEQLAAITNFDECAEAGYPIMESYPPVCRTPDGRTFTQEIKSIDKLDN